ncbi:hypothetical protein Tco_0109649 [Tanacetum coccineum]
MIIWFVFASEDFKTYVLLFVAKLKSNGVGFNYSLLFVAAIREEPGGLFGGGGFGGRIIVGCLVADTFGDYFLALLTLQKSRLLLFLLKIMIYGSGLLILSAYAPSLPLLLSLSLLMTCDDSDGAARERVYSHGAII